MRKDIDTIIDKWIEKVKAEGLDWCYLCDWSEKNKQTKIISTLGSMFYVYTMALRDLSKELSQMENLNKHDVTTAYWFVLRKNELAKYVSEYLSEITEYLETLKQ